MMLCAPAGPCGHVGGHVGASMTRRISSPLPDGPKRVTSFARVVAHPRRRPCDHYRHRADRSTRPCRARDRPPGRGGSDPGVESRCVPRVGARQAALRGPRGRRGGTAPRTWVHRSGLMPACAHPWAPVVCALVGNLSAVLPIRKEMGAHRTRRSAHVQERSWRRRAESNRRWRFCRPLPYHLATPPRRRHPLRQKADDRAPSPCPLPMLRKRLERVKGLEPSTFCMASRRSSQLSYTRSKRG